jgi:anti-sigma B factor antagonist
LTPVPIISSTSLEITVDNGSRDATVRLRGRINVDSSPDLRDRLLAILLKSPSVAAVAVDLTGVSYIDTSGIATLIEALKISRHRQIAFSLQGLNGSALQLFQVTGVLALFGRERMS